MNIGSNNSVICALLTLLLLFTTGCEKGKHAPIQKTTKFNNILVLGNSITKCAPVTEYGWYGNWGMAASSEEKDFIHVLRQQCLKENKNTSITPLNISDWENYHSHNDFSKLDKYLTPKIDLVIVRLGENVREFDNFDASLTRLIRHIESKAKRTKFIITGVFWKNPVLEDQLKSVALKKGIPFVPIGHLDTEENRTYIGAKVKDTSGNLYELTTQAVASHPGDEGMQKIADLLYKELVNLQLQGK